MLTEHDCGFYHLKVYVAFCLLFLVNVLYGGGIVWALLEHISNPAHPYASLLPCVRTLVMLTEHKYGFYHLKVYTAIHFAYIYLSLMC